MTILTKHTIAIKKTPLIPEISEPERDIESPDWSALPGWMSWARTTCIGFFTFFIILILGMSILIFGVLLYHQYMSTPSIHRFQGFCTIPIGHRKGNSLQMAATEAPRFRGMPFRFSLSFADDFRDDVDFAEAVAGRSVDDDVQVLSTLDELTSDEYVNSLREELDIGDSVEKISVIDNGHRINFIHDFNSNITGIVDSGRCFTMELDPSVSLPPAVFALGMSLGGRGQFDVSRVRSTLRAVLPALHQFSALTRDLLDTCQDKPIYQLRKEDAVIIRKRSVDEPPHDYIQFAGKHVQEIEINNLAEILEYEQNNTIHNQNSTA